MSEVTYIEPWRTRMVVVNLKDKCDLESLSTEIVTLGVMSPSDGDYAYPLTDDEFPTILNFVAEHITPIVLSYIKDVFEYKGGIPKVETFGRWLSEGDTVGSHLHGSSGVTTIFYPDDYATGIVVYDPRGNACRGYPREMRDNYFKEYHHTPKSGELLILPSYLAHYVPPVKDSLRLTLVNDYYF